jgi:hypothetical protein
MRKVFSILAVAVVFATTAWAQDLTVSVGAGALGVGDFAGGYKKDNISMSYPNFGGGGFVFFDVTYAEVSVGFLAGGGDMVSKDNNKNITIPWTRSALKLAALGKFPVDLSNVLIIFPATGVEYDMVLSANRDGTEVDDPDNLSALWVKIGAGLDVAFADQFYFRSELLFGIRLANKEEEDEADLIRGETLFGFGPTVKIGVGYTF